MSPEWYPRVLVGLSFAQIHTLVISDRGNIEHGSFLLDQGPLHYGRSSNPCTEHQDLGHKWVFLELIQQLHVG